MTEFVIRDTAGNPLYTCDTPSGQEPLAYAVQHAVANAVPLPRADLSGLVLKNGHLKGGNFMNADFTAADIQGTDCTGANMVRTTWTTADCTKANFTNADMQHAVCYATDFTHAVCTGANFRNADLRNATMYQTQDAPLMVFGLWWDVLLQNGRARIGCKEFPLEEWQRQISQGLDIKHEGIDTFRTEFGAELLEVYFKLLDIQKRMHDKAHPDFQTDHPPLHEPTPPLGG